MEQDILVLCQKLMNITDAPNKRHRCNQLLLNGVFNEQ